MLKELCWVGSAKRPTEIISDNITQDTPPLIQAVRNGARDIFFNLLKAGENLELIHQQTYYFAHKLAISPGRTVVAFDLHLTALDWAIIKKDLLIISCLLKYRAKINHPKWLLDFLNTQNPTNPRVTYCLGVRYEQLNDLNEAEKYYQLSLDYPPARQASCRIAEKKDDLLLATHRYAIATSLGKKYAPAKLISIAQRLLEKKQDIKVISNFMTLIPISAHLTSQQWMFVAIDALGNPHRKPMEAMHFAFQAAQKAVTTASNPGDVKAAKNNLTSIFGIFRNTTGSPEECMDIISEYCDDKDQKNIVMRCLQSKNE